MAGQSTTDPNQDTPVAGNLALAVNIFTAPTEAFAALRRRPAILFPLLLVVCGTVAVMGWYFSMVDYDWYIDETLDRVDLAAEQLEAARERMASIPQRNMAAIGMGGSAISLLALFVAQATYLTFVSALGGDAYRFRHWLSLVAWTHLPHLLVLVTMAVNILLSPNGQLAAEDLNGLSLYNLGMQTGRPALDRLLGSLSLTLFWSVALLVGGYRQWLGASRARGCAVVLSPYLLVYGIWAYLALSR